MSQLLQTAVASYEFLMGCTVVTMLFVQWPLQRTVQGGALMVLELWPAAESKEKINANLC